MDKDKIFERSQQSMVHLNSNQMTLRVVLNCLWVGVILFNNGYKITFVFSTATFVSRWILSITFKRDINNDYGIYPENGDVVMEAVDRNDKYEQQAAGGEDQANGSQVYHYENWEDVYEYDNMYEGQVHERGNRENEYDKMYD